jgi:hypothetical protein
VAGAGALVASSSDAVGLGWALVGVRYLQSQPIAGSVRKMAPFAAFCVVKEPCASTERTARGPPMA